VKVFGNKFQEKNNSLGTLKVQQSIINGVGGRKTMFEKLLLAVTITFSLNLFIQVRIPDHNQTRTNYQQQPQTSATILVTRPDK
jgi:hypothetical protein